VARTGGVADRFGAGVAGGVGPRRAGGEDESGVRHVVACGAGEVGDAGEAAFGDTGGRSGVIDGPGALPPGAAPEPGGDVLVERRDAADGDEG
jgi:hypothetical protein